MTEKIDELIAAIQQVKILALKFLSTRPRTFNALDKAEKIAGWELADILKSKGKENGM